MRKEKRGIMDYFSTYKGNSAWKTGKRNHDMSKGRPIVEDGKHACALTEMRFEFLFNKTPLCVFKYELYDDRVVEKPIAMDSPDGITSILHDLHLFGIEARNPEDLLEIAKEIEHHRYSAYIDIYTRRDVKTITVVGIHRGKALGMVEVPAAPLAPTSPPDDGDGAGDLVRAYLGAPQEADSLPPPQDTESAQKVVIEPSVAVLPPIPEPEPPNNEVDVVVGDTIEVRFDGERVRGKIVEELPVTNKLAIKIEGGREIVVDAKSFIRKIA